MVNMRILVTAKEAGSPTTPDAALIWRESCLCPEIPWPCHRTQHGSRWKRNSPTYILMIVQLDWFGCEPRDRWEVLIHQTLEQFAAIKAISRVQVRIEQLSQKACPYQVSVMLSVSGPDVLASAAGYTFEEALLKLNSMVRKTLTTRAMKMRELNGAPRGVKATHRG
jgi:hypothetical protein